MWMMGYNDGGDFNTNNIQDSFNNRRLRNLMPRPAIASASTNPPCLIHGTDHLFALNHHLAMAEHNKRELNTQQVVVSSRWNPTPEQLQTLEELYRRGTRTPSAEQIQHITSQLRRYGKIEGKNVFYWFQNHKARERQKRRRQLESSSDDNNNNNNNNNNPNGEKKESLRGANRTLHEVEQTKNWASPTNSSTIASQKGEGGAKASDAAECKADGWVQFDDDDEAELLQRGKNATWRMMHLSCSNSSPTNLINSCSAAAPILTTSSTINPSTPMGRLINLAKPHHQDHKFVNNFLEPYQNLQHGGGGDVEAQTLELFPLMSGSRRHENEECGHEREEEGSRTAIDSSSTVTPYPYFEFLPLKN